MVDPGSSRSGRIPAPAVSVAATASWVPLTGSRGATATKARAPGGSGPGQVFLAAFFALGGSEPTWTRAFSTHWAARSGSIPGGRLR
jgi:hypothetical protein